MQMKSATTIITDIMDLMKISDKPATLKKALVALRSQQFTLCQN